MTRILVVVLALVNSVAALDVFYRPLGSTEIIPRAVIDYDAKAGLASISSYNGADEFKGRACVGAGSKGGSDFRCTVLADIDPAKRDQFIVHIDKKTGKFQGLDYNSIEPSGKIDSPSVSLIYSSAGPVAPFKDTIKPVGNKIPEPEVEQTFIQKYWMYILPAALMVFASSGGSGQ